MVEQTAGEPVEPNEEDMMREALRVAWLKGYDTDAVRMREAESFDPEAGFGFEHQGFEYRIKGKTVGVRRHQKTWHEYGARHSLPNLVVGREGITFPLEDLIDLLVARAEPNDIAECLFANKEVRQSFLDNIAYTHCGFAMPADEASALLSKLSERVYADRLNRLTETLTRIEAKLGRMWERERTYEGAQNLYNAYCKAMRESLQKAFDDNGIEPPEQPPFPPQKEFSTNEKMPAPFVTYSSTWSEFRKKWEERLHEYFGAPEKAAEHGFAEAQEHAQKGADPL